MNWIFFDEAFNYVAESSGYEQVGDDEDFIVHLLNNLPATKNGFCFIYVSNDDQNIPVYFDNLQVTHIRGPLLEEDHYYPFGLTQLGISSKALAFGGVENKKKFNDGSELSNKEFSDGSGLEIYETTFRGYDPQVGRFHQVDQLAEVTDNWTPYAYCNNNPILFNDPLGLDTTVTISGRKVTFTDSEKESWATVTASKKSITIPAGLTSISNPGTLMKANSRYNPFAPEGTSNNPQYIPIQTRPCANGCINPGHPDHNHAAGELVDQIIVEIASSALPISKLKYLKHLKFLAKKGKTVLGKFPDYLKLADKLNARRFNIPEHIWAKMTDQQRWAANVKFLDRMIARGDDIILSNPVKDINIVTGAFRKELDYLIGKGFRISKDGTHMIK